VTDQWWRERPADKTATKAAPCRFPPSAFFIRVPTFDS
jgi:hypothetical protein